MDDSIETSNSSVAVETNERISPSTAAHIGQAALTIDILTALFVDSVFLAPVGWLLFGLGSYALWKWIGSAAPDAKRHGLMLILLIILSYIPALSAVYLVFSLLIGVQSGGKKKVFKMPLSSWANKVTAQIIEEDRKRNMEAEEDAEKLRRQQLEEEDERLRIEQELEEQEIIREENEQRARLEQQNNIKEQ